MSKSKRVVNSVTRPLRVLIWDIETAPGTAYFWRPRVQFINQHMVINAPFMICWSAKWLGEKKIYSDHATPEEIANRDDARICVSLTKILQEADVIVAHNGDNFDEPFLRGRLFANNLAPLGPVDSIDTKKIAAKDFDLPHNNLDAIAKIREIGEKDKTDFSWWTDILEGSKQRMKEMVAYNRKDVVILEEVFEAMRPHATRLKRLYDAAKGVIACTNCGGTDVHKRGTRQYRTQANTFQQYQCQNPDCMRYFRIKTGSTMGAGDLRHL
jgi:hypothetical protein